MEVQTHTVGERAEKFCETCGEQRGHVVDSVTKHGRISRVTCPKCGTRGTFKSANGKSVRRSPTQMAGALYDRTRTYKAGQTVMHPVYGHGEITALIEPEKIDVLFADRLRRLIHARSPA
jgi:hypothetical protein